MATQKEWKLRYDRFVSHVRPDAKSAGDPTIIIQGFIGKSNVRGHIRVYSDEALNNFVDLDEKDILYATELSEEESPLGGSKLWVKATAEFLYGDPSEDKDKRPKGSFLRGDIMTAYEQRHEQFQKGPFWPITRNRTAPCLCQEFTRAWQTCATFIGATCPRCDPRTYERTCYMTCPPCDIVTLERTCRGRTCPACVSEQVTQCIQSCNITCVTCPCSLYRCPVTPDFEQLTPTPYQGGYVTDVARRATGFEGFNPYRY